MKKAYFLFVLFPLFVAAQNKDSIALTYADYISIENLKNNLSVIASDEYEGRETGRRGQKLAAEYIANQFKLAGIQALTNNSYFQQFLLDEKQPGDVTFFIRNKEYTANKDFYNFSGDVKKEQIRTKKVEFLGYGIEDKNYNDYQGVKVKNKTILILSGEPVNKDSLSLITREKANRACMTKPK